MRQSMFLTLYHTIPTFNDHEDGSSRQHFEKRRKCCLPAFSTCPKLFSFISIANLNFSVTFILSIWISQNLCHLVELKKVDHVKSMKSRNLTVQD